MEILKITRDIASNASHIYALSWKTAYKNIVPQKYLDDLSLERWTPLLQDSPFVSFVVRDKGEFVATSSISAARDEKMEGWGEIISIYVLPQHFRKGYGKKLFAFVINQLRCSGFDNIYLWVLEDNKQAREFYEQNGFAANGERKTISVGGEDIVEVRYIHTSISEVCNMNEAMTFSSRDDFRAWLQENCRSSDGIWLLLGKPGGPKTIKAEEALEQALCFGWIDGQMQSIDANCYKKYFSLRRENSKWSEKNKALVEKLETQGSMTDLGRQKIQEAKQNGQWSTPKPPPITQEQLDLMATLLKEHEPAYTNFQKMSPSVQKTYTRAYLDAKTDPGRLKRLAWMVERLNNNQKPM